MLSNYICALDLGSSKIACAAIEFRRKRIANITVETLPSKGISDGAIVDAIGLASSISDTLKKLKIKSGINIKSIYANASGKNIVLRHSHAIIPLAERGNKVITYQDMQRANEQARILGSNLEEEIIQAIPSGYTIDSRGNILNPAGLYSHSLGVDLYLICAKLSFIQNLTRIANQAGYEIKDLFFSGIATKEAVFDKRYKDGITVLCDIGSDTTELLIFEDGTLRNIEILSSGGNDLTCELTEGLKIPFDLAEDIKRSYASAGGDIRDRDDREILIKKDNIYKPIKHRLVSEIVTSKTKLICQSIKEAIEKNVACSEINNFITTGRTVLLEGFLEMLENNLRVSVKLGRITRPDIIPLIGENPALSGQKYLTYLTCLGIACLALKDQQSPPLLSTPLSEPNAVIKMINKIREVYQEYF